MFPPGTREARHEPLADRIAAAEHHDGNGLRRLLRCLDGARTHRDDDVQAESHEFPGKRGEPVDPPLGESSPDDEILAFDVA